MKRLARFTNPDELFTAMSSKQENKGKQSVVPSAEINGSDADKAYDQNGNAKQGIVDQNEDSEKNEGAPEGSDADTDQ